MSNIPIRVEIDTNSWRWKTMYIYSCDECNKEIIRVQRMRRNVVLCSDCKKKHDAEKRLKDKEKKEAEMRKYHIRHLKEFEQDIIEIITDSPSKADVITDRKILLNW